LKGIVLAQYRFEKLFSPEEANELIPTLEGLVRALQLQVSDLRERIRKIVKLDHDVDSLPLARIIDLHPELKPAATRMGELAQQVESLGCFLKDIDQGLVDFPAELNGGGDVVFLCWQFGEHSVLAWHPVEGGFTERKPLPGARKQYLN
jgi:hypothetical protein